MPRLLTRFIPTICLALMAVSCQSQSASSTTLPRGGVTHVVIMWLYDRADQNAQQQILGASDRLSKIPGVISISAGRVLPSDRPVVDSSFDLAYVISFRSEADARQYLENPTHVEIKKNTLDRYVKKYLVYDMISE